MQLSIFLYTTKIFINLDLSNFTTAPKLHQAYDLIKEHWLYYVTYITQKENEYGHKPFHLEEMEFSRHSGISYLMGGGSQGRLKN